MYHLVVFTFIFIISSVTGQTTMERCATVASYASSLNPGSSCAYREDAFRCFIKALYLAGDNVTEESIQGGKSWADFKIGYRGCNDATFEDILNEVKAKPELLELQGCFDTATRKDFQEGFVNSCGHIEEAVRCGIRALKLNEEDASDNDLVCGRQFATRYLTPYGCHKTFNELLTEVINSGSTVSPIGWFTAIMVAFIFMFTAMY